MVGAVVVAKPASQPPEAQRVTAHFPLGGARHRSETLLEGDRMEPSPVDTQNYLLLAAALFCIGMLGVLVRRNALIVFMCIELMLNAANLTFLAAARQRLDGTGHLAALFVIAVAAAEAAIGLAIVIAVFRNRGTGERGRHPDDEVLGSLELDDHGLQLGHQAWANPQALSANLWLIIALSALGALVCGVFGRALGRTYVNLVGCGSVLASFACRCLPSRRWLPTRRWW